MPSAIPFVGPRWYRISEPPDGAEFSGQLSFRPTINLSGTIRFSNGVALLTENYLIGGGGFFGIQGLRFMGPKHSFDIGMFNILGDLGFIIPFVGYSMTF